MGFFSLSKKLGATVVTAAVLLMAKEAKGENGYSNGYWWIENNGVAMIYDYDGAGGAITIPSSIEGYPVGVIGREAFSGQPSITTLHIPDSVSYVDYGAFANCQNLTEVRLPQAGAQIGNIAFAGCIGLTSIEIPSGISLGNLTFAHCTGLVDVAIKEGVTNFGDSTFYGCSNLKKLKLPNSLTSLGIGTFQHCTNLEEVTIPSNIWYIPGVTFEGCYSLKNIAIPKSITDIRDSAFLFCTNLTSVTLPSNLSGIGTRVFAYCTSLTKVCFEGSQPLAGNNVFLDAPVSQIYYLSGKSWDTTFQGIPTVECNQCFGLVTDVSPTGPAEAKEIPPTTGATNLIMVIHGWTPFWASSPYSDDAAMPNLAAAISNRISADGLSAQWRVEFVDWSKNSGGFPQDATRNALRLGGHGRNRILDAGYKSAHLIAHSAGTWMAQEVARSLCEQNFPASVTFLDAYTPSTVAFQFDTFDQYYAPDKLGLGVSKAEHYYHRNWSGWGLGNILTNSVNHDITTLQDCAHDKKPLDSHGWPIRWYSNTVFSANYSYANNLGYHIPINIQGSNTVESCGAGLALEEQNQLLTAAQSTASSTRRTVNAVTPPPPLPPVLDPEAIAELRSKLLAARAANPSLSATKQASKAMVVQETDESGSGLQIQALSFVSESPSIYTVKDFAKLAEVVRGGTGSISTNGDSIQLSTTNFIWGTFAINTTNGFNLGALSYDLAAGCNSIVGLWMDGEPATLIQSAPEDSLETVESFPLSKALGSGNHLLTVSLESLDQTPITATLRELGLYLAVEQPEITSHSMTNGQFQLEWEAGAGLKYQPQFNDSLASTNWNNLGGLLTSPTNAVMSAFDAISTNSQRFYRIKMSAD